MEKSFAFNSDYVNGKYDREYFVEELLEYFADLFRHGISPFIANNLQVIANGDMSVTLKPGVLWDKNGCKYKNTEDLVINLSPADGIRNRIDRISITWKNTEREMLHTVQEGESAYNPKAPVCRRNANYRDYVVADVFVRAGAINITQANITDQRLNSDLCGMAAGLLRQFDLNEFFAQINAYFKEFVQRTDGSYEQFLRKMEDYFSNMSDSGQQKYEEFKAEIIAYINALKEKGDTDLAELLQGFLDFRNENEEDFLAWFEGIREILAATENGSLLEHVEYLLEVMYDVGTERDIDKIIAGIYIDDENENGFFEAGTEQDIDEIIAGLYEEEVPEEINEQKIQEMVNKSFVEV